MIFLYGSAHLAPYDLLALALAERCGFSSLPKVARDAVGKPFLLNHPQLHFNLSHSGPLTLCALGREAVGVDIQRVRPCKPSLPGYALTEGEYADFLARGGALEDFYALWTRREAWVKFTGKGLAKSRRQEIPKDLRVQALVGENWRGAVCSAGPVGGLEWR